MEEYASLIIDIEKSRGYNVEDRNILQNYMFYCVENLNILFRDNIEHNVTFSAGDELQGLFSDVTTAIMYFRLLEMLLKPVNLRAGIGVGAWTVKIAKGISTQQDGPVYHRARYAIEEVYNKPFHNIRICSDLQGTEIEILANHLINTSNVLKKEQIYKQNIVLVIVELLCPFIKDQMKWDSYKIIKELLELKYFYKIGRRVTNYRINKVDIEEELYFWENPHIEPIFIDGKMNDADEHILKKSITTFIADILGCTRQNVDSILKRGHTNKIRELDYIALQYIERIYGK